MFSPPLGLSLSKPYLSAARGRAALRQAQGGRLLAWLAFIFLAVLTGPAAAQTFPKLTGRIVDEANLLTPAQEIGLEGKLEALEKASSRQLVIATVPDLQGYPIEDYGYRLGRAWRIGQSEANNGVILLVAPTERKVRIEVGYGLEPIVTDAISSQIIQQAILPRFRENDYGGGIVAGTDALIAQLQAPPELAEQRAREAAAAQAPRQRGTDGSWVHGLIFWGMVLLFVVLAMSRRRGGRGKRFRSRGGGSDWPIVLWAIADAIADSQRGGGGRGGGFGGFGGGGGGGFSGGGGSFGGGGASGSW